MRFETTVELHTYRLGSHIFIAHEERDAGGLREERGYDESFSRMLSVRRGDRSVVPGHTKFYLHGSHVCEIQRVERL